jgi:hypothetical protein
MSQDSVSVVHEWKVNHLKRLRLYLLFLLVAFPAGRFTGLPALAQDQPNAASTRESLDEEFQLRLKELSDWCREQGLDEERTATVQTLFPRDPQRQYLFLPEGPAPQPPAALDAAWREKLRTIRSNYAEQLFQLAGRLAEGEQGAPAYQLLHEVLYWDPEHVTAREALGHRRGPDGWQAYSERLTVREAPKDHPDLNWPARSYQLVTTENFEIASRADEATTRMLAEQLQRWQWVWRQVMFDYWSSPAAIRSWLSGKTKARPAAKKYRVVLFRSKEQYIAELGKQIPGIEVSTGYYSDQLRLACFFASQESQDFATWRHELTHQLFQETIRTRKSPFSEERLWLGEGIAMYFEGLYDFGDFVTLGGFDTRRLQYARLRCLQEGVYLPFAELDALSQNQLQAHPEVRQLYSQSAGLTQFLMTAEQGRYRAGLIEFLKGFYSGKPRADAWSKTVGMEAAELDRLYPEFLRVEPGQLQRDLIAPEAVTELALPQCELTDRDFEQIGRCSALQWLELGGVELTAERLRRLEGCGKLRQLFASGSRIERGALAGLQGWPELTELDLSGSELTLDDLRSLAGLKRLRILSLRQVSLPEEGAEELAAVSALEQLDLSGSRLATGFLERLRTLRPELKIIRD